MVNPTSATNAPVHVRQLGALGYAVLIVASLWFWHQLQWKDPLLMAANIGMLVLGVWPMLRWLKRHDATYPIMEFLLLATVPFYALPVLTGHEDPSLYRESTLLRASLGVLAFQAACIAGSALATRPQPPRHYQGEWWRNEILPETRMHFTAYTAGATTLWLLLTSFTDWFPTDWIGTLRAVFFGIGIISVFIQARLWGGGHLSRAYKLLFWINVLSQVTLMLVSLLLINGIGLLLTAFVGYFSSARRVPWLPVLLLLPIIAVLHNGKSQMRQIYWSYGQTRMGFSDLPAYFSQWVDFGLSADKQGKETESTTLTYGLMRRASLFQIVCIAVDTMPGRSPFLHGSSYEILLPQLVPRFLWPGKPSPHESVKLLSVQLGILTEEETETTSIGFGMLTEAYANFGYLCVIVLGGIFGYLFRRLADGTVDCATLSMAGLLRILCLVWCLNAETTLAVWFSSLYQACLAIGVPLLLTRSFLKD